jgi:hypothetical protein
MTFRYRRLDNSPNGGDMTFGRGAADFIADTPQAVAQAIYTRLLLFQGEWFLDVADGTPWYQQILGKPRGPGSYDATLRARIAGTPFVTRLTNYASSYNPTSRTLTVGCTVDTSFGAVAVQVPISLPAAALPTNQLRLTDQQPRLTRLTDQPWPPARLPPGRLA